METGKITSNSIYQQIFDRLKQQIISGSWKPGHKLPSTRELAEQFQVGMSTVREALSALKAMGLVESRQGEGSYVRIIEAGELELPDLDSLLLSRTTVLELLEVRKALEVSNAAIAAEKRSEADLAEFRRIVKSMQEHLGNEAEGEKADMLFHLTLAKATHNTIMVRLLETISGQMEMAIRETRRLQMYANRSVSEQLWHEHQEIYEAVARQDPELAQTRMKQHLFHVEKVLLQFLKRE